MIWNVYNTSIYTKTTTLNIFAYSTNWRVSWTTRVALAAFFVFQGNDNLVQKEFTKSPKGNFRLIVEINQKTK